MQTKGVKTNRVQNMANGVPRDHHSFMKMTLCNDEVSSDEELHEHFVSEGVHPEHAAQYIKHRTRYLTELVIKDDGTLRFPSNSDEDRGELLNLADKFY